MTQIATAQVWMWMCVVGAIDQSGMGSNRAKTRRYAMQHLVRGKETAGATPLQRHRFPGVVVRWRRKAGAEAQRLRGFVALRQALDARPPAAASVGTLKAPMDPRIAKCTTSSPGRRPFEQPALSTATTPSGFCDDAGTFFDCHAAASSSVACRLISATLASAFDNGQSRLAA